MRLPDGWFEPPEQARRHDQAARACLHCAREPLPTSWRDLEFELDRGQATPGAASLGLDVVRSAAELLRARPDLAVRLTGGRAAGEPRAIVARRIEAVRRGLVDAGAPPEQLEPDIHSVRRAPGVSVVLQFRQPGPVLVGDPCGTTVLAGSDGLGPELTARGWWMEPRGGFWYAATGQGQEPLLARPLAPLHGSQLAPIVPRVGGYATLRDDVAGINFAVAFVDPRSKSVTAGAAVACHPGEVRDLALAARPDGLLAAWTRSSREIYTQTFDLAGAPLRACSRELVTDDQIRGLAIDWHADAGAIAHVLAPPGDLYGRVDLAWLDAAGHLRGEPRTLAADTEALYSVALAIVGTGRVTALLSNCAAHVARVDLDARGDVTAFDHRFMRAAGRHGVAVVRDGPRVWGLSLGERETDARPLCH